MKKAVALLLILSSVFACVSKKSADELNKEKDSLAMVVASKDSILNDVFSSINLIADNLDAIKTRENIVTANATGEISKEQRAQINEDITAISELLEQNRATISKLKGSTEKLRKANIKIQELERLVENMNKRIEEKDADIAILKGDLEKMNIKIQELNTTVDNLSTNVSSLSEENKDLESTVASQTDILNTVYYIVGTEKELLDGGIVTKSGVVGRTLKVGRNYDLNKLTKVDKRNLDNVLLGKKKVTIVTHHPAGSYEIKMKDGNNAESLVITDSAKFWESSRVLIISYK